MSERISRAIIFKICGSLALICILSEIFLRLIGISPANAHHFSSTPLPFFIPDSVTGWKTRPGSYSLYRFDSKDVFTAEINRHGNRLTSYGIEDAQLPSIHIYGCEFTFGFSIPDTATSGFKLQKLIPEYKIENKASISYGLTQMYLSLQESLASGDTPKIAIFNYGSFQDMRTPLHKRWSAICKSSVTEGEDISKFKTMRYPYFELINDSLQLKYEPLAEITGNWPLTNKSSFWQCLNSVFYLVQDLPQSDRFHTIAKRTALQMMQYCRLNHITPVFATVTPESTDILEYLGSYGFYTLNYNISIKDSRYNCSPMDPAHPNGLAHTIYAQKLDEFLKQKNLLQ